jgi:hypothetical protein
MKAQQLKGIIRSIVQEEIKKVFKSELQSGLLEIFTNSTIPNHSITQPHKSQPSIEKNSSANTKTQVKYTQNDILNQVLNETTGGVPQEGNFVGMVDGGFNTTSADMVSESVVTNVPDDAPEGVKTIGNILNRDYSSLMSAIDNKRKGK